MKKIGLVLVFVLFNMVVFGQESMTFKQAEEIGISKKLDSLYRGGIDSDSTKSVFKDQKSYIQSYQKFIFQLADFLAKNNFKWGKQVRCFNRIYFSKQGTVDYFLYNFKEGEITPEQEKEFRNLLQKFIQQVKFGLKTDTQFAQCSPVRYTDLPVK
ncbi:hypothetical protein [Arcicella rosea]|uniref:Uncharacterized protein n=1 Tax=Arcicella rosea TaxID=502909 RepID=A0A841ENC5_9BACT|nr:hypothetical protein [Arcicella rosea]MBB6005212.1 hypothetical protein [Arcicella rosea]